MPVMNFDSTFHQTLRRGLPFCYIVRQLQSRPQGCSTESLSESLRESGCHFGQCRRLGRVPGGDCGRGGRLGGRGRLRTFLLLLEVLVGARKSSMHGVLLAVDSTIIAENDDHDKNGSSSYSVEESH